MKILKEISTERAHTHFPIESEERILTMDKALIIEAGWQVVGKRSLSSLFDRRLIQGNY